MAKTKISGSKIKKSRGEVIFEVIVYAIATVFCIYCLFPFAIILGSSFETEANFATNGFPIIPKDFTTQAYKVVLGDAQIFRAYGVTIFTTVAGTIFSMFLTITMAYPLSLKKVKFRNVITFFVYFTMLFGGGLVPTYLLITKNLGLKDNILVLIIPVAFGAWNMFLMRNFFNGIPHELSESLTEHNPDWEFEFFLYIMANEKQQYAYRPVASSRISVSAKTKYPEIAVKFLEKIHTDKRYYDLFLYGVEGIHYHLVDGKVSYAGVSSANKFAMNVAGDGLLNYNTVPVNEQWGAVEERVYSWEEAAAQEAMISPLDGFSFVPVGLDKVVGDMEAARILYFQPLVCGYYEEEEDIAKAVEELRRKGLDQYLESIQSALKEYMDNQKGE